MQRNIQPIQFESIILSSREVLFSKTLSV